MNNVFKFWRGQSDKVTKNYFAGLVVAILVVASFLAGASWGSGRLPGGPQGVEQVPKGEGKVVGRDAPPPYALKEVDFSQFWDVWKLVKERYVEQPVSDVQMFYGAVEGMVGGLKDPYSVFLDPEIAKKFAVELSGEFDGIGAEIGIKNSQLVIIAPLAGTPAEKAGLKAGDKILAIDGTDTGGMLIDEAVTRIRGPKGTQVKLLIFREGFKEPKEITITRATITVESVNWKTEKVNDKKIAAITISNFNERTEGKFKEAARAVLLENPDGLIVDLRNNPGGFLDTAVKVAGEWIKSDVVVQEKFIGDKVETYRSDGSAILTDIPTVVLINKGSASASEIVAGALQDYGKAKIVGEKSYGKGSVQDYVELDDGSALKLTVAIWLTPKGRSINKEGITPDIEVKMTPEDFDAGKDPQMDKAKELIIELVSANR